MGLLQLSTTRGTLAALTVLGVVVLPQANAQLVTYSFPGNPGSLAPTSTAANLTADNVNFTGSTASLVNFSGSLAYNIGAGSTTAALAVTNGSYFQFTVTPSPGFVLNFTSLQFDAGRGYGTAGGGYALRSSVDNFTTNLTQANFTTVYPTFSGYSSTLTGASFQSLSGATTLRLYVFDTQPPSVNAVIRNLVLNGTVSAASSSAPEPGTWALVALGIAAGAVARRRRK